MASYNHEEIEKKWQKKWEDDGLYCTKDKVVGKENFYTLVEYPYPSGNLHAGHWHAFAVPDIFARYKRMKGFNVMFPIGFDSFGLPAENAAIKNNVDPKKWTYQNIDTMVTQLKSMGAMFDWSRKVVTSDEDYYKWTQWLFIQLYKKGLAYKKEAVVNWDPVDQTVLANEQVLPDGTAERSGAVVEKKKLTQWFLKITDYADRLLDGLDELKWPEQIKQAQREWIGKNEGAEITFRVKNHKLEIKVFTTRPDTLFGATYVVLAPEHKLLRNKELGIKNYEEVERYIKEAEKKTELDRQKEEKEKTGIELKGIKAINPANNEEIPIFVADYVLMGYGTGSIMAVPAHDERDFAFAKKFDLPINPVILKSSTQNRSFVMGVAEKDLNSLGITIVEKTKSGFFKILIPFDRLEEYKIFIREQMEPGFWNEFSTDKGFYFIFKHKNGHLEEMELNAETNNLIDRYGMTFNDKPENEMPQNVYTWLSKNSFYKDILIHSDGGVLVNSGEFDGLTSEKAKVEITKKVGGEMKSTYRLRDWLISRQRYWGTPIPIVYDPEGNAHEIPDKHLPWMLPTDVDFKPTGVAPLARSKELKERTEKIFGKGWTPEVDTMDTFVDSSWYFLRYTDSQNKKEFASKNKLKNWMPVKRYSGGAEHTTMHVLYSRFFQKALYDLGLVEDDEPYTERYNRGLILGTDGRKMSKRWGNVINPDEYVKSVGADVVRMYLGFIGPYNVPGNYPWDTGGLVGIRRFLEKVVKASEVIADSTSDNVSYELNKAIKKVGEDIESFKFNTAVSQSMILLNAIAEGMISKEDFKKVLQILSPFAPHIAEELWEKIGNETSVHLAQWPKYDESKLVLDTVSIVIQVNGKTRGTVESSSGSSEEDVLALVRADKSLSKWTGGDIKRVIYVVDKLLNIVL